MSRLETIRKIVEQQPNEAFPRYGLAMELKNAGQNDEAHAQFEELEKRHPEYVAQYLMHANLLSDMRRVDEAKACLQRGIAVGRKAGNAHAVGEMEQALQILNS